jgi:hypothetical protein
MAYLTVRKRDDSEVDIVICMFSMACLWSRAIVRRRTATIFVLSSSSKDLEQASKDRTRRGAQKKCQCRRNWTIFSPWYNNINRLTTIIEKEREGRQREREKGSQRAKEKRDDTQIHQPEDCGFLFYSLSVIDEYRLCLAALRFLYSSATDNIHNITYTYIYT